MIKWNLCNIDNNFADKNLVSELDLGKKKWNMADKNPCVWYQIIQLALKIEENYSLILPNRTNKYRIILQGKRTKYPVIFNYMARNAKKKRKKNEYAHKT